jgi:hypothetical protein
MVENMEYLPHGVYETCLVTFREWNIGHTLALADAQSCVVWSDYQIAVFLNSWELIAEKTHVPVLCQNTADLFRAAKLCWNGR